MPKQINKFDLQYCELFNSIGMQLDRHDLNNQWKDVLLLTVFKLNLLLFNTKIKKCFRRSAHNRKIQIFVQLSPSGARCTTEPHSVRSSSLIPMLDRCPTDDPLLDLVPAVLH